MARTHRRLLLFLRLLLRQNLRQNLLLLLRLRLNLRLNLRPNLLLKGFPKQNFLFFSNLKKKKGFYSVF
jgi:hypothetical protein